MSIRMMSAIWDLKLPPSDKLVLLALADWAHDDGRCWPSITAIAAKSGVSERTVQRALRVAENNGLLTRQEICGKGCQYTLDPRQGVTGDMVSPATNESKRGDTMSPYTLRDTLLRKKGGVSAKPPTSKSPQKRPKLDILIDDVIDRDGWIQWAAQNMKWDRRDASPEVERFIDYSQSKGTLHRDWLAAWRKWCRSDYCHTRPRQREPICT